MSVEMMHEIEINGKKYREVNLFQDASAKKSMLHDWIGKKVLIRSYDSGVHVGTLVNIENDIVNLKDSNRIWSWEGAFTLSAVATKGVDRDSSKISCVMPFMTVFRVCEIMSVEDNVDLSETKN